MARTADIASGRANPLFEALVRRNMHELGAGAAALGATRTPGLSGALVQQRGVGTFDPLGTLQAGLGEQLEARRLLFGEQFLAQQRELEKRKRYARYFGAAMAAGGAIVGGLATAGNPAGIAAGASVGSGLGNTFGGA